MPYQAYFHIVPDESDIYKFKYEKVNTDSIAYNFHSNQINKQLYITNYRSNEPLSCITIDYLLKQQKAKYFLVIKNDTIVYSYTDEKIKSYSPVPSFSISKSFVSACVGIALQRNLIHSVDDLVNKYLPELSYHPYFDSLTINHLLNQESGLKVKVNNVAYAYYGNIEKCLKHLSFISPPGKKFEYVNINYTLLGLIIERVSNQNLHTFFSNNIWSKIGTCDSSVWGYDYKSNHTRAIGAFAGSVKDYAKFGKLYLNNGNFNGQSIIDSNWVKFSTTQINALNRNYGYNNSWYIGEKEIGDYMAIGMYRQQIYIHPKSKVIIVSLMKFNKKNLTLRWWEILRQITYQLN
jgi:CubicO group peptidase (beta-lactamase class C family)